MTRRAPCCSSSRRPPAPTTPRSTGRPHADSLARRDALLAPGGRDATLAYLDTLAKAADPWVLTLPFLTGSDDPFEAEPVEGRPGHQLPARETCISCHPAPGLYAVNSFTRRFTSAAGRKPDPTFRAADVHELDRTAAWKQERYEWGLLKGMMK